MKWQQVVVIPIGATLGGALMALRAESVGSGSRILLASAAGGVLGLMLAFATPRR